jgi:hypothetical protein
VAILSCLNANGGAYQVSKATFWRVTGSFANSTNFYIRYALAFLPMTIGRTTMREVETIGLTTSIKSNVQACSKICNVNKYCWGLASFQYDLLNETVI